MSGPKVVRIVTREEILGICYGQLARLDAVLAEWTRIGRRCDCIDEEAIATSVKRRNALAALIAADRFVDLQKQAPIEEEFLRNDMQARLTKVATEQAAARSRARRERDAAASLLRTLRASGRPLEHNLEAGLECGDSQAIKAGFELLADNSARPAAAVDLAARLREDGAGLSFADWLAWQPATISDPAAHRIEVRLDELTPFTDPDTILMWRARLQEAGRAPPVRLGLLLDALEVETSRFLTEARRRAGLLLDLRLLLAEAEAAGMAADLSGEDLEALETGAVELRLAETRAALDVHRATKATASRRAAVLEGLTGLGYEVIEGMSTTLARDGRLVLRSAARPDYGVEVSAAAGAERMQMRAVALEMDGRGPDPARDRDAETIWCGDVSKLQEKLTGSGSGLRIEKALPVGATPLKRVAVESTRIAKAEPFALRERRLH
jgi:hypothetical protein